LQQVETKSTAERMATRETSAPTPVQRPTDTPPATSEEN
jgi:hypothetical protein